MATSEASAATPDLQALSIAVADLPARADADEKFARSLQRRARESDKQQRFADTLAEQAASLAQLGDLTEGTDLATLSVWRLESLERHWHLHARAIGQTRAELARTTNAVSEEAADLARRHASWVATEAQADLPPALRQRASELVILIHEAQEALEVTLATLLDLGRKSGVASVRVQEGLAEVVAQVEDQDRRLVVMDAPPLWQAARDTSRQQPFGSGVLSSFRLETAFAQDYDATRTRLLPVLALAGVLLWPLMFWFRRRARQLVTAGDLKEDSAQVLARPWAAWLLLVAAGAVLYDIQGPGLRQQAVMVLAWVPLLGLLQRRIRSIVGPWAYLSAAFYLINVIVSMLVGNPFLYRVLLLALTLLMMVTLVWRARRTRSDERKDEYVLPKRVWSALRWIVCGVLAAAAVANVLGNVSLSSMLVSAILDSTYAALAIYTGSRVLLSLLQVLLAGPTVSRLVSRHATALVPAIVSAGRALLFIGWLVFTLQAFRVYRPASTALLAMLTYEFQLGVLSLSLGNVVSFAVATWAAFWLAGIIRRVLAESVLPGLALPRGVSASVSSLTYYSVLFLGLLTALAAAGFHVGQLTIIFGALGVGIGIGLQDVVRNFVSGLILMFERPIQRGDTVEVAGMIGRVGEIGLRATRVTTFEGADVVVPNGMLLADKLVNWTLSGTRRRVSLDFGITYAADPRRVIELLVEIARGVDGVSFAPAPAALVMGLANGVQEVSLRVWTKDHVDWIQVRSDLAIRVRSGLSEAGIEMALPQRDLRVRGVPGDAVGGALLAAPDAGRGVDAAQVTDPPTVPPR